ncbi:hypothetical protein QFZ63_004943 [Streptomyces sp. B3I7]|uniref:hypothetical protein n=1 Tax=Streptomyces sp. B3I7 TaxID=3042269 RepID=UPI00278619A5|nr:hypothetical protein [Streptomyces sp. B3I7]MDQ0813229.1 hypothetical protein [Streptomyces sp. B3I7]
MTELRRHLLPRTFDPTGSYPARIYERTRAFRVLSHAEFESFLEDRAVEVANAAFFKWRATGAMSLCLLALVAHAEATHPIPATLNDTNQKKKFLDLSARVEAAKNELNRYVRTQNHGIKEKNILRILVAIGVADSDIDPTWIGITDAWATSRGEAAHKTAKMQVQPDPQHELKTVRQILEGFRDLDALMSKL